MSSKAVITTLVPSVYSMNTSARQGFRPIRVWGALARQNEVSVQPAEVVRILRSSFMAVLRFGSIVPVSALWMDRQGEMEIVGPDQEGFTSPAWFMEELGMMACELLSGAPIPDSMSPQLALHLAKAGTEISPSGWDPALGFVLERMLGLVAPYQSVGEALMEVNDFYLSSPRPSLAITAPVVVGEVPAFQSYASPRNDWAYPALLGGAAASLLFLIAGGAYWLGSRRAPQSAPPVIVQAPAGPAVPTVVTLDPTVLAAIKQVAQAARRPVEAQPRAAAPVRQAKLVAPMPPAALQAAQYQEDDGPVYAEPISNRGQAPREDSGRVKTGDFVARRR